MSVSIVTVMDITWVHVPIISVSVTVVFSVSVTVVVFNVLVTTSSEYTGNTTHSEHQNSQVEKRHPAGTLPLLKGEWLFKKWL